MVKKLQDFYRDLSIRQQQLLKMGSFGLSVGGIIMMAFSLPGSKAAIEPAKSSQAAPVKADVAHLSESMSGVDEREVWIDRIQTENEQKTKELEEVKTQNKLLEGRVDIIDNFFKQSLKENQPSSEGGTYSSDLQGAPTQANPSFSAHQSFEETSPVEKRGKKIARISFGGSSPTQHSANNYLPSGSYAKAALLSGAVAQTATNAQGNPLPIVLRLIDDGNLPRGFTSRVRDAHLIGACYGDISSERVMCRLETMSWVEQDGATIERKIEGWVVGEDGRPGLRGKVVDRSDDITRQAMVAGILSSIASFFQAEATKSVYPISPFGQTNAMGPKDMIQGAAASGASNALNKLAEFAIKRAEQMQPVILVAAGRVVDVVFKTGVDVSPFSNPELKVERNQTEEIGEINE